MITYTKSLLSDFEGNFNMDQFNQQIVDSSGITTTFHGSTQADDIINLLFESELSGSELTILNNLISNYVYNPSSTVRNKNFYIVPRILDVSSKNYLSVSTFVYEGINIQRPINYIDVISYKDQSITNYSIRIFDKKNGKIIAEKTGITNTELDSIDLGTISNLPAKSSLFEVHVKKTGGNSNDYVHIEGINIYYG